MNDSVQRVQYIVNVYFNGNKKKFADKVGVSAQALNSWFKVGVGNKSLSKVAEAFPEIDKKWLFFGEGAAPVGNIPLEINGSHNNTGNFENAVVGSDAAVNAELRQQIQDLKDQLAQKDKQIEDLIKLMMQK